MRLQLSPLRRLLAVAIPLLFVSRAPALTVIAPTFDELVASATVVVRGTVTDVHCITVDTPQGTAIKTLVTFNVERALKGSPGSELTLSFLGGKVGRRHLKVVGMPQFKVGERQIVFVGENGKVFCPLIAAGHGRYHVRHDTATGRDYVTRDNHQPLTSTQAVVAPLEPGTVGVAALDSALTLEAFETSITTAVAGLQTRAQK